MGTLTELIAKVAHSLNISREPGRADRVGRTASRREITMVTATARLGLHRRFRPTERLYVWTIYRRSPKQHVTGAAAETVMPICEVCGDNCELSFERDEE
jgi:hypothetical protein